MTPILNPLGGTGSSTNELLVGISSALLWLPKIYNHLPRTRAGPPTKAPVRARRANMCPKVGICGKIRKNIPPLLAFCEHLQARANQPPTIQQVADKKKRCGHRVSLTFAAPKDLTPAPSRDSPSAFSSAFRPPAALAGDGLCLQRIRECLIRAKDGKVTVPALSCFFPLTSE